MVFQQFWSRYGQCTLTYLNVFQRISGPRKAGPACPGSVPGPQAGVAGESHLATGGPASPQGSQGGSASPQGAAGESHLATGSPASPQGIARGVPPRHRQSRLATGGRRGVHTAQISSGKSRAGSHEAARTRARYGQFGTKQKLKGALCALSALACFSVMDQRSDVVQHNSVVISAVMFNVQLLIPCLTHVAGFRECLLFSRFYPPLLNIYSSNWRLYTYPMERIQMIHLGYSLSTTCLTIEVCLYVLLKHVNWVCSCAVCTFCDARAIRACGILVSERS